MKNVPIIGLDNFHYTPITKDDTTGVTYGLAVKVPNIVECNISPNVSTETFYADDGAVITSTSIGEFEVEINVGDLSSEDYAFLLGADYAGGVVDFSVDAVAPEVAISFRAQKADGSYRYMTILKGKFSLPEMNHATKADGISYQTQTITFVGVKRAYDGKIFRRLDSNDNNLPSGVTDATLVADFFENPDYIPVVIL